MHPTVIVIVISVPPPAGRLRWFRDGFLPPPCLKQLGRVEREISSGFSREETGSSERPAGSGVCVPNSPISQKERMRHKVSELRASIEDRSKKAAVQLRCAALGWFAEKLLNACASATN
jgi:hypothetical protein